MRRTRDMSWLDAAILKSSRNGVCIEYNGARKSGYGMIRHEGKMQRLHRLSYKHFNGPLLPEDLVMHSCDNPACWNPKHLSVGTPKANAEDCVKKGRKNFKLSAEDVQDIRVSPLRTKHLAEKYGVSPSTISNIRVGRYRTYT